MVKKQLNHKQRLIRLRETLGFTQREMAKEFGVAHGAVGLWEAGKRKIPGPVEKLISLYEEELDLSGASKDSSKQGVVQGQFTRGLMLSKTGLKAVVPLVAEGLERLFFSQRDTNEIRRRSRAAIARQIVDVCQELKGFPQKLGQVLSYAFFSQDPQINQIYAELQTQGEPLAEHVIVDVILEGFGKTPRQLFAEWDPKPMATASIGQVHRAKTVEDDLVAVKVQYPKIREAFLADLKSVGVIEKISTTVVKGQLPYLVDELKAQFLHECDYIEEGRNINTFRELFKRDEDIIIPQVFGLYSCKNVLTTELVEGRGYYDFVKTATWAEKQEASKTIFKFVMKSIFEFQQFNTDPHPGNYIFTDRGVGFIDFGSVKKLLPEDFGIWKNLIVKVCEGDQKSVGDLLIKMGTITDPDRFDEDHFFTLLRRIFKFMWYDGEYSFEKTEFAQIWDMMLNNNPNMKITNQPREQFMLNQLLWGMKAILSELEARGNWHKMMKRYL